MRPRAGLRACSLADFFYNLGLHITQSGTVLAIVIVVSRLVRADEGKPGVLAALGICLASAQLRLGLYPTGAIVEYPHSAFLFLTTFCAIPPLVLHLGLGLTNYAVGNPRLWRWLLIPAAVIFVGEVVFVIQPTDELRAFLRTGLREFSAHPLNLALLFTAIFTGGVFAYLLQLNRSVKRTYDLGYTPFVWMILAVPSLALALAAIGFFFKNTPIFLTGTSLITLTLALVFVFTARHPNFFDNLGSDIKQKKYETVLLSGLDLGAVKKRLAELMIERRLYLDDALKLADVAAELMIGANQLSRIINETKGLNFNDFVNTYRVEHAKKLLAADPEASVLTIAYQSGFNTKSTFNRAFSKLAAMTPAEYRKQKG